MDFKQFFERADADDIVSRLPSMSFIQRAELDKNLHNQAIDQGAFGQAGSADLQQDKMAKTAFERILAGDHSPRLIRNTIEKLQKDKDGHLEYLAQGDQSDLTGDRKWHSAWMNVYSNWINHLRRLLVQN